MRTASFPDDEPIEPQAFRNAALLAGTLRQAGRSWVAPELRARQTAEALRLPSVVEPALRECDHGRWHGRSFPEIHQAEPAEALAAWMTDPSAAPHGGESLADLSIRATAWLDRQTSGTGHVIVVTHANVIRTMVLHAIAAPLASFWRIDVSPLSCTRLSFNGRWRLRLPGYRDDVPDV